VSSGVFCWVEVADCGEMQLTVQSVSRSDELKTTQVCPPLIYFSVMLFLSELLLYSCSIYSLSVKAFNYVYCRPACCVFAIVLCTLLYSTVVMVGVASGSLRAAYRQTHSLGCLAGAEGRRPLGAVPYSSHEPRELSQWL